MSNWTAFASQIIIVSVNNNNNNNNTIKILFTINSLKKNYSVKTLFTIPFVKKKGDSLVLICASLTAHNKMASVKKEHVK